MRYYRKILSYLIVFVFVLTSVSSGIYAAGDNSGGNDDSGGTNGGGDDYYFNIVRFQAKEKVEYAWDIDADVYKENDNYKLAYTAEREIVDDVLQIVIGVDTNISFITNMTAELIHKDTLDDGPNNEDEDGDSGSGGNENSGSDDDNESGDGIPAPTTSDAALVLCTHDVDFYNVSEDGITEFIFYCDHSEIFELANYYRLTVEYQATRGSTEVIETISDTRTLPIENHEYHGYAQIQLESNPPIEKDGTTLLDGYLRESWLDDLTVRTDDSDATSGPLVLVTLTPGPSIELEGEDVNKSKTTDNPDKDELDLDPIRDSDYEVAFNVLAGTDVYCGVKDLGKLEGILPEKLDEVNPEILTLIAYEYSEQDDDYNVGPEVLAMESTALNPESTYVSDKGDTEIIANLVIRRYEFNEAEFGEYLVVVDDEGNPELNADGEIQYEKLPDTELGSRDVTKTYFARETVILFEKYDVVSGDELKVSVNNLNNFSIEALGNDLSLPDITTNDPMWYISGTTEDNKNVVFGTYTTVPDVVTETESVLSASMTATAGTTEYKVEFYWDSEIDTSLAFMYFDDLWVDQYDFLDPLGVSISNPISFNPDKHEYLITVDVPFALPNGTQPDMYLNAEDELAGVINPFYTAYDDAVKGIEQFIAGFDYPTGHQLNVKPVNPKATTKVEVGNVVDKEGKAVCEYTELTDENKGGYYTNYRITVSAPNVPSEVYTIKVVYEVQDATLDMIDFDVTSSIETDAVIDAYEELKGFDRYVYDYTLNQKYLELYGLNDTWKLNADGSDWLIDWDDLNLYEHSNGTTTKTEYFSAKFTNDTVKYTITSPERVDTDADGSTQVIPGSTRIYTIRFSASGGGSGTSDGMNSSSTFDLMKSSSKVSLITYEQLLAPSIAVFEVESMTDVPTDLKVSDAVITSTDFKTNNGSGKHQQFLPEDESVEIHFYQYNLKGKDHPELEKGKMYMLAVLDGDDVYTFSNGKSAIVHFQVGEDLDSSATLRDATKKLSNQNK